MGKAEKLRENFGANIDESMGVGKGRGKARGAPASGPPARRETPGHQKGAVRSSDAMEIELDRIIPDPDQPRTEFDADSLSRLAESMKARGQLQPISVRWADEADRYVILSGERRWRAARMAGLTAMKTVVVKGEVDASERLAIQVIENCLREDLAPIEQARAYRQLQEAKGWNVVQVAAELHVPQPTVTRALALLELPESVRERVEREEISPGAAYEISKVAEPAVQEEIAAKVVTEKLTRDQTRQVVEEVAAAGGAKRTRKPPARGRGGKPALETSRAFNHAGIRILAEARKGFAPGDLLEALRHAADRVAAEIAEAADRSRPPPAPRPYAWEMVLHKYDGTTKTVVRVAPSEAAAKRKGLLVAKVDRVEVVGTWTRDEYRRVYGSRSIR
jgi:ParB family chromosome partitioning protein